MVRSLKNLCLLILCCLISNTVFANVSASTDRVKVPRGESLQLTLMSNQITNHQGPDISPLNNDFDILSKMQSTQMSVMNGKRTESQQWVYVLVPKHTGPIIIPAIAIGQEKTKAITIQVTEANDMQAAAANRNVFLTATLTPVSPYVQSQTLYTLKLYYASQIANPELKEPDSPQIKIYHTGRDLTYPSTINGRNYQVMELHFLILPQTSGTIQLQPAEFSGNMMTQSSSGYYGPTWRPVVVSAPSTPLAVKPIPANLANNWWLPASSVTLSEQYQPALDKVKAGEPVSRTITIHATGTMDTNLPKVSTDSIPGASVYLDKPTTGTQMVGDNMVATRIERMVIIPDAAGQLTLPAITLPWFNTQTHSVATASLPAHTLTVIANPHINQGSLPPPLTSPLSQTSTIPTATTTAPSTPTSSFRQDAWFWLASLVFLLWIITMIVLWFTRKHMSIVPLHIDDLSRKQLLARAHRLANANDAQAFSQLLLSLAKNLWPTAKIHQIADLKLYLDDAGKQVIDSLNHHLYHRDPKPWQGEQAWFILKKQLLAKSKTTLSNTDLPPIYPKDSHEIRD